jgi:hypothetical protein
MDRRRFVPEALSLEGRELLSLFGGNSAAVRLLNNPALQVTIIRNARVERLPGYLYSVEHGRTIPPAIFPPLEDDLRTIEGNLHAAPSPVLGQFNRELRSAIPHASLTDANATALDQDFGDVLSASGAGAQVTAKFRADMQNLARVDSFDSNAAELSANDYAFVAEMVEGIGVPIRTPAAPRITVRDLVRPITDHLTTKTQPRFTGSYDAGTTIQIIDSNGTVLGSEKVPVTGNYIVKPTSALSPGTYTVHAYALNPNGNHSLASATYTFTVLAPGQSAAPGR